MIQVLPREETPGQVLGNALGKIGASAAGSYLDRADEMALQKTVMNLPKDASPRQVLDAVTNTRTHNPKQKIEFLKNAMGVAEFEQKERQLNQAKAEKDKKALQDITSAHALVDASAIEDEAKQELKDKIQAGEISLPAVKELVKPPKTVPQQKLSEFEKGVAKENVKRYTEAEKDLIEADRTLGDLERIDELTEKLEGPLGFFKALNPFNEDASELNSLGYTAIKPIIKIFNPSGPLAQKKLEQILTRFGINATDSSAKIKGKVNTLRRFATAAKEISEKRIALIKEFNGNPPLGAMSEIDKIGQNLIDEMAGNNKKAPEGKVRVRNKQTGQVGSVTPFEGMETKYEQL